MAAPHDFPLEDLRYTAIGRYTVAIPSRKQERYFEYSHVTASWPLLAHYAGLSLEELMGLWPYPYADSSQSAPPSKLATSS